MAEEPQAPSRPDLSNGVALGAEDGAMLAGTVGEERVLLVRSGGQAFAIGAECTHYPVSYTHLTLPTILLV